MNQVGSLFFALMAGLSLLGAVGTISARNPIRSAMGLLLTIVGIAGLFLRLNAQFMGAIQLIVYAGAVVVLFVFVVMLLNLGPSKVTDLRALGTRLGAGLVGLALLANLLVVQRQQLPQVALAPETNNAVTNVAQSLFSDYLVAFELTSVVLLVAIVGAVLLAKKRVQA